MPGFVTTSETARPPDETFDFMVDLSRWSTFRGFGPVPGIVRAELVEGASIGQGSRVRVVNTDDSVHHEVIVRFERGRHLGLRMELSPPASYVLDGIDETVELTPSGRGTRVERRFELRARSRLTAPVAWLVRRMLRRAVEAHDRAVVAALAGSR